MVSILEKNYIPANIKTNLMLIYYRQNPNSKLWVIFVLQIYNVITTA
jgi:hypothetical protein